MPCSDNEARDFLEDHRVKSMQKEINQLEKEVHAKSIPTTQKESNLQDRNMQLTRTSAKFAIKLNQQTELLCKATWILFQSGEINDYPELKQWFTDHTEEDANRLKLELDKILNHKSYTLRAIFKWVKKLDEKETWVLENHNLFSGLKLNK